MTNIFVPISISPHLLTPMLKLMFSMARAFSKASQALVLTLANLQHKSIDRNHRHILKMQENVNHSKGQIFQPILFDSNFDWPRTPLSSPESVNKCLCHNTEFLMEIQNQSVIKRIVFSNNFLLWHSFCQSLKPSNRFALHRFGNCCGVHSKTTSKHFWEHN
jgi:hypothetical protein